MSERFKTLSRELWAVSTSDVSFFVAFFGSFQIRMIQVLLVVCMLLWIQSFIGTEVVDASEAKDIFAFLVVIALIGAALAAPLVIFFTDRWPNGLVIGIAFAVRGIIFLFGYPNLRTPKGIWAPILTAIMLGSSGVAQIYVESFYAKMTPSHVAGTMKGVFNFFGQIGVLCITLATGYLYDNLGPASPFLVVGALDSLLALITISLCALGRITK